MDIICLDDGLKYRIMAIKTNENFIPFSNSLTFRKPRGTDVVTASEVIPGFCQLKSNVPNQGRFARSKALQVDSLRHQIPAPCTHFPPPPHGIYIDRCITSSCFVFTIYCFIAKLEPLHGTYRGPVGHGIA